MSRIDIHELTKLWTDVPAVDQVSFTVPEGSLTVLLGPSGCGKSTILRLIAGLEAITAGVISIGGKDVTYLDPAQRGVSMVFQSYALFPHLTVRENILFGLKVRGTAKEDRRARLAEAAKMVGLTDLLSRKPAQLSGGQRQRIAIARAIYGNPSILILDEATSSLDSQSESIVQKAIDNVIKGRTAIVIAHRLSTIRNADKIIVMDRGAVVDEGTHEELLSRSGVYADLHRLQSNEKAPK